MPTLTETLHAGGFIVSEGDDYFSREDATVAVSQSILAGHVLGKVGILAGITAVAAAAAGNTGNGVLTLANPAVDSSVKDGVYSVVFIEPVTNLGSFEVVGPDGAIVGTGNVGAAFAKGVKFTIADGAADFVAGDRFTITVGRESVKDELFKALDVTASDGSEVAAAIAVYPVTTGAGATGKTAVIARHAQVRASDLTWPVGISAIQQAAAVEQLRARGIILR